MIKLSKINEGMFDQGIKRAHTGEVRKEDDVKMKLEDFCTHHDREINSYKVTSDNKVNCIMNVFIYDDDLIDGKIPFQFKEVRGFFDCGDCNTLTSLEGCPEIVGKSFNCKYSEGITSLEGSPKIVEGSFNCSFCGKKFTEEDVKQVCDVKGKIHC